MKIEFRKGTTRYDFEKYKLIVEAHCYEDAELLQGFYDELIQHISKFRFKKEK